MIQATRFSKIKAAYNELSQEAFAALIRMSCEDYGSWIGRGDVARTLGISYSRCNVILRELAANDMVRLEPSDKIGEPTVVVLEWTIE